MAQPNWKTELGIRKKAQPIDLETLDPDTREKVERKRALQREATSKSRARKKALKEQGEDVPNEVLEKKRKYMKLTMRERRSKIKGETSLTNFEENDAPESSTSGLPLPASNDPPEPSIPPPAHDTPGIPEAQAVHAFHQPTETTGTPPIIDLTTLPNCRFPDKAKEILWPGGTMKTKLPWISDREDPEKNILQNDENHVRFLAETALPAYESDWVSFINYDDYEDDFQVGQVIQDQMSRGKAVVVKGYPYKTVPLTAESLWRNFKISKGKIMVVSDAEKRVEANTFPHIKMSCEQFCQGINDDSRVQCILDCPTVDGEKPSFIKFIDDGHTAWYQLHERFPDRVSIPLDVQKSSSWLIFHQAMYHTFCHHDADGYNTWTQILDGYKFWVLTRPKNYKNLKTRKEIYESCIDYLSVAADENGFYGKDKERFIIYGGPGDIIIQPAGCLHEVYTPTPSVTRGGHFYSYASMHHTEFSRALDKHTDESFSNQTHPCANLTIMMMMAALPGLSQAHIRSKSLAALCRMVISPTDYSTAYIDPDLDHHNINFPKKKRVKELSDVLVAQQIAKHLKSKLSLDTEVCHTLENNQMDTNDFIFSGESWFDPGVLLDCQKFLGEFLSDS